MIELSGETCAHPLDRERGCTRGDGVSRPAADGNSLSNWLSAFAGAQLAVMAMTVTAGIVEKGFHRIEWHWVGYIFAMFIFVHLIAKGLVLTIVRRCLLRRCVQLTDEQLLDVEGPRWALDTDWLENMLADPARKSAVKAIDAATRKGGHLYGHLLNLTFLLPVVITSARTTEAMIGGAFTSTFVSLLRILLIFFFSGPRHRGSWRWFSFFFCAADRIRDGRWGQMNILLANVSTGLGFLGPYLVIVATLPPEHESPALWDFYTKMTLMPLVIGDAMGEIIGTPFGRHQFEVQGLGEINKKSVEGCVAVFCGSLLPCLFETFLGAEGIGLSIGTQIGLPIVLSTLTTFVEAVSYRGTDNFSIPICNALAMHAWKVIFEL